MAYFKNIFLIFLFDKDDLLTESDIEILLKICLVNSLFDTSMYSNVMNDKYRKYVELVEKGDSRNEIEDIDLVELIKYFKSIPIFMAKDIILDFKKMERERQNG